MASGSRPRITVRGPWRRRLAPLAVGLAFLVAALLPSVAGAANVAWVDTGGDCLKLRSAPGLDAPGLTCLDHGTQLTLLDGTQALDGFTWQQVDHEGQTGWVADFYITTNLEEVQPLTEPTAASVAGLIVPPEGGLTIGIASAADPAALVAAQPYPVAGIWSLDVATQELRQYLPGAPVFVNTLTSIPSGAVVVLRRAGALNSTGAPPEASLTVAGTPNQLPTPPIGGITQGIGGTTDPRFLVQAQPFTVQSVAYFHVESQQWLVYLPGAPDHAQSLRQGQLRVDSVVSILRAPDAPGGPVTTGPTTDPGARFETSITYYYCVPGSNPAAIGDGGGYCGGMANGETVHEGAAACAPDALGQRFTIEGDPTARIYTCTDTGGAVLNDHRDIWFMHSDEGYAWWTQVGPRAYINILPD
jgi:uncharacterized protein YraI